MAKGTRSFKPTANDNTEGKRTILLIAALLVAIVVMGGALFLVIMNKSVVPTQPPVNQTNQTVPIPPQNVTVANNTSCDDQCHLAAALRGMNFSECQLINNITISESCSLQLSNVSLDACKAVSDQGAKDACLLKFASADNDSSLCSLMSNQGQCLGLFETCSSAQDKNICEALRDKDPAECAGDLRCLMNYSMTTGNSSACSVLTNPAESSACISATLMEDNCVSLPSDSPRNYCYELYAIYRANPIICEQIPGDNLYSLACLSYFAETLKNLSICDSDSLSTNSLWSCYTNYSLATGDTAGCTNIDPLATSSKFACAFAMAKKFGNPADCQVITFALTQRDTCYEGAILYSNQNLSWQNCEGVVNVDWQDECYTASAKLSGNVSICDNIATANEKLSCQDAFALYEASKNSTNSTG